MKPPTEREYEVMLLFALGHTNKSAAHYCGCSLKTLEKHKQAIYFKWGVSSVTAMIRVALRSGELTLVDFLNSKLGEDAKHEIPQHLERVLAPT